MKNEKKKEKKKKDYNFTRGSFYISEYIYTYVKIHTRVNFADVNCILFKLTYFKLSRNFYQLHSR